MNENEVTFSICERHFDGSQIRITKGKKRLKDRAIPTIFHPNNNQDAVISLFHMNNLIFPDVIRNSVQIHSDQLSLVDEQ